MPRRARCLQPWSFVVVTGRRRTNGALQNTLSQHVVGPPVRAMVSGTTSPRSVIQRSSNAALRQVTAVLVTRVKYGQILAYWHWRQRDVDYSSDDGSVGRGLELRQDVSMDKRVLMGWPNILGAYPAVTP